MHQGGQNKTIPIHRTYHAIHEAIRPLTQADVYVHGEGLVVCLLILRLPTHGAHQDIVKLVESYWTHVLYSPAAYPLIQTLSSSCYKSQLRLLL